MRNCISLGDGRAKNNGGIFLWSDPPLTVHDTTVAHCTVVMDAGPSHPAAIRLATPADGLHFRNNCFVALGGAALADDAATPGVDFAGDSWFAVGAAPALPPGQVVSGAAIPGGLVRALPEAIVARWCAGLTPGPGALVPLAPAVLAVLRAAGCSEAMPDHVGARPLPRYGP